MGLGNVDNKGYGPCERKIYRSQNDRVEEGQNESSGTIGVMNFHWGGVERRVGK